MNITDIQYADALKDNKRLGDELQKEKDRNQKIVKALAEVTAHNIALRSQLNGVGLTFDISG